MFPPGFLEKLEEEKRQKMKTSLGRFEHRVSEWKHWGRRNRWGRTMKEIESSPLKERLILDMKMAVVEHHFWWFVHNCIAHPMIGVCPHEKTFAFHDYTSDKINSKNRE